MTKRFDIASCKAVAASHGETRQGHTGSIFLYAAPGTTTPILQLEFMLNTAIVSVVGYELDGAAPTELIETWKAISHAMWCDVDYDRITEAGKTRDLAVADEILADIMKPAAEDAEERAASHELRALLQAIADHARVQFTVKIEPDRAELFKWRDGIGDNFHEEWAPSLIHAVLKAMKPRGSVMTYDLEDRMNLRAVPIEFIPGEASKEGRALIERFLGEVEIMLNEREKKTIFSAIREAV